MPLTNFIQVFPIHTIQAKEMVLTKKAIQTIIKFLAKREPKLSFLSSFTFFDWHECDVSNTKVS